MRTKWFLCAVVFFCGMLFAQKLPVFLLADSVQTGKILRSTGDTTITTDFTQRIKISYAETVIVVDTLCSVDTCLKSNVETLRVVLDENDTAKVPVENDTIVLIGTTKNLNFAEIPMIDPNPSVDGDEIFIWSSRREQYCDTLYDKDEQSIMCHHCGTRQVFDFWYIESTATAILLHHFSQVRYPADDSCAPPTMRQQNNASPAMRFSVKENGLPLSDVPMNEPLPVAGVISQKIADTRKSPLPKNVLIGVRFNPESLITTTENDTVIVPFSAIDGSWIVRWKWLWDGFAGENGGYTGYVPFWDDIEWSQVDYADEGALQFALAAPAQYYPTYAGDTLGSVDSIIAKLQSDGIADDSLYLCYPTNEGAIWNWHTLEELFYKGFSTDSNHCGIVFSRPMDTLFRSAGNLCDNSKQAFFCPDGDACDGVLGMRSTGTTFRREYWADALRFYGGFNIAVLCDIGVIPYTVEQLQSADPQLVVYVIGAGSVPRIWLNGEEHIISPNYFPSYGDPYGYVYNGYDTTISSPPILWDETNQIEIEHISPVGQSIGAQVILALKFVPPDTVVYVEPISYGDEILINAPILRGIELADSGQSTDTAQVAGIDTASAVIVFQRNGNLWQNAQFLLQSDTIIVNFGSAINENRLWRWWFFTGSEQ